jgi:hypothetical protein
MDTKLDENEKENLDDILRNLMIGLHGIVSDVDFPENNEDDEENIKTGVKIEESEKVNYDSKMSEIKKEESDWGSDMNTEDENKEISEESLPAFDDEEAKIPTKELLVYDTNRKFSDYDSEKIQKLDPKYHAFVKILSDNQIFTKGLNKLYSMMEMLQESTEEGGVKDIREQLRMTSMFKILFEKGCEKILFEYYGLTSEIKNKRLKIED